MPIPERPPPPLDRYEQLRRDAYEAASDTEGSYDPLLVEFFIGEIKELDLRVLALEGERNRLRWRLEDQE